MKITVESTAEIAVIEGQPMRLWHGTTAGGVEIVAFIRFISVRNDADQFSFAVELEDMGEQHTLIKHVATFLMGGGDG